MKRTVSWFLVKRFLPLALILPVLPLGAAGCGGGPKRISPEVTAPSSQDPFVDVTQQSGINWVNQPGKRPMRLLESLGFGGGFLDFDNDGWMDVFLVGSPRCGLFRNQQDGTFRDVSSASGLTASGPWIGFAVGDYDRDGFSDLLVTGYKQCLLYHNQGNGTFKDATPASGLSLTDRWFTAATFADFDRDGLLDLYVGAYCQFGPKSRQYCVLHQNGVLTGCRPIDYDPELGRCFRNLGGGKFQDVTSAWGLNKAHGKTLGAAVADYNQDGWPDLYLANDEMPGDLFRNEHGKRMVEAGVETGTAYSEGGKLMGGMGVDWGDVDNDGWPDLAIGTFESEAKVLFRNLQGRSFEFASGRGGFLAETYPDVVFGTLLFDFDNDGWLDLLFANGHTMDNIEKIRPTIPYRQPTRLFRNQGNAVFQTVASDNLAKPITGRAVASGDFENNGTLGLLVVDMDGKVRLLKNAATKGNHWLKIDARGSRSNREALGARITVTTGTTKQTAEVSSARSYLSACDRRTHFGLGSSNQADEVEIRWPSGAVTRLKDVAGDQILPVTEGK